MTEVYLLFYQSVIPLFTRFNKLLQREDPVIFLISKEIIAFVKNLLSRFVKPQHIVDASEDVTKIKYSDHTCQLEDSKIYLGLFTRSRQSKLLNEGDVSPHVVSKFLKGVRSFYECATSYALTHLPLDDQVLQSAQIVDIQRRIQADFTQVAYFVTRFSKLLPYSDTKSQEQLFEQFTQYQIMQDSAIPTYVWDDAKVLVKNEGEEQVVYYRMDVLWAYLASKKDLITGQLSFSLLANVAKLVLTLPHSNADEEQVFCLIRQNKTDFRSSLSLDGTLSSIMTVKMASEEPCYKFEPSSEIIRCSKKATWEYNKEHMNKNKKK